jgi:organic radical activating enzyme
MMKSRIVRAAADYAGGVASDGPSAPSFDGLRVVAYPNRLEQVLLGDPAGIAPVTVEMWPSLSCNARCPLCPYRLTDAREYADADDVLHLLDLPLAEEIIAGAKAVGARSIILTGGGEPLMHPAVVEIAGAASHHHLRWAMFTNGILLSASLANDLLALSPAFLRVSLDAGTAEEHARVYSIGSDQFPRVLGNIVSACRIALRHRTKAFGLGFTLGPKTEERELEAIRDVLCYVVDQAGGGLGLVAFRPRIVHYVHGRVVWPQPHGDSFLELAQEIRRVIVVPLAEDRRFSGTRLDIKEGLFKLAAECGAPRGCYSGPWMTNVDQLGIGYITAELAGSSYPDQSWGKIQVSTDFPRLWYAYRRYALHNALASSAIAVPHLHRTAPIGAFLDGLMTVVDGPVHQSEARGIVTELHNRHPRLSNVEFV